MASGGRISTHVCVGSARKLSFDKSVASAFTTAIKGRNAVRKRNPVQFLILMASVDGLG